jgi:uncharacterized membrane protein
MESSHRPGFPRAHLGSFALVSLAVVVAMSVACGSGDLPLDEVDPEAVPANPTYEQVYAVLDNRCVACHSGDGESEGNNSAFRIAAGGTEPNLSDCSDIVSQRYSILDQVDNNTMPPGAMPRLTSEQKLLIQRWIDNGAPAPCN